MIKPKQTMNGKINLQILRIGDAYKQQKGGIFLKEWTNVYFSPLPQPPESDYLYHDIRKGIPFDDNTFDALYALRIIEHLTLREGEIFVSEIYRVLKPGGICRLTAPDLEDVVRQYLKQLELCSQNRTQENVVRYHWSLLELYDQIVREQSGGQMVDAIKQGFYDQRYCKERFEDVFEEFIPKKPGGISEHENRKKYFDRFKRLTVKKLIKKISRVIKNEIQGRRLRKLSKELSGDPRKTLEANKWMFDRLSMRLLLEGAGFKEGVVKNFKESDIPDWERYNFDCSNFGDHPIEPSLFFEARK